ncbi:universal stress protein [Salinadaptatus halalkaliphilus]|uniref:Universal stress protein n=1 Tax=Salinadaptatus halalkaliphilus TaxID=2419781 RepID=A0A4S3TMP3_9EURY|nr:universal stress protein [Salinadaptatus halalkaliphilus]THE64315.1 universal stress protein [Salinadaptatus halalkaliphilus]
MHVLVPTDDSEPARKAIEHAASTYPEAELTLLHVINPTVSAYTADAPYNIQRAIEAEEETAEEAFETAREIGGDDVSISTETLIGSPARGIVQFASEHDVDHVVLGSHGRSGVTRVLLGSVAETVVRRAPVPVTVVR